MKKNLLNLAAGIMVMFAACKNESATVPVTVKPVMNNSLAAKIVSADPASNPSNPLDSVGLSTTRCCNPSGLIHYRPEILLRRGGETKSSGISSKGMAQTLVAAFYKLRPNIRKIFQTARSRHLKTVLRLPEKIT